MTRPVPVSASALRRDEIDPIYHMMPHDQLKRVFASGMCDIDPEFLGFTEIYLSLAPIIPKHWTVIDLGCAYAPQSFIFKDHREYVGVDLVEIDGRFAAPNARHFNMTIENFIERYGPEFDHNETFAICSYVPPWHGDNMAMVRAAFKNVFTYYPHGGRNIFPATRPTLAQEGK